MRDAFGGAFMIELFIVFIFIYVIFISLSLNYAKAFKVKNSIINYIEENELIELPASYEEEKVIQDFFDNEIIGKYAYYPSNQNTCNNHAASYDTYDNDVSCKCFNNALLCVNKYDTNRAYWTVETYADYSLGFIQNFMTLGREKSNSKAGTWVISGETRVTVNG